MVPTQDGTKIPLKEIAAIKTLTGPAFIYRDNNSALYCCKIFCPWARSWEVPLLKRSKK